MSTYKLVSLPGDGVGPEINRQSLKVLQAVASAAGTFELKFEEHRIGGDAIDHTGEALPEESLVACRESDAILLGAVGGPKWDDPDAAVRPEQGLLKLRKELDLFANLRPIIFFDELLGQSPLRADVVANVDILFVRELTGGIYFGEREEAGASGVAWDKMVYSDWEVERIVRVAAEAARGRGGDLLSVDKANVLASSRLWRKTATAVVETDYPDVRLRHGLVDSVAMDIITRPRIFDVVVTENMFGDILTDEASVIPGSLGLLPSASLSSPGRPGVYEPIHGSAPDIAGQGKANPIATVMSAAMCLRHSLGEQRAADALEGAVRATLADGFRTPDIAVEGEVPVSTDAMGDAIADRVAAAFTSAAP